MKLFTLSTPRYIITRSVVALAAGFGLGVAWSLLISPLDLRRLALVVGLVAAIPMTGHLLYYATQRASKKQSGDDVT
jgi:hypothetical protein